MDSRGSAPLTLATRNRFDPAASLAARGDVARTQRAPLRPTNKIGRCTRDMRSAARGGHDVRATRACTDGRMRNGFHAMLTDALTFWRARLPSSGYSGVLRDSGTPR
jgi:hypothetical protein